MSEGFRFYPAVSGGGPWYRPGIGVVIGLTLTGLSVVACDSRMPDPMPSRPLESSRPGPSDDPLSGRETRRPDEHRDAGGAGESAEGSVPLLADDETSIHPTTSTFWRVARRATPGTDYEAGYPQFWAARPSPQYNSEGALAAAVSLALGQQVTFHDLIDRTICGRRGCDDALREGELQTPRFGLRRLENFDRIQASSRSEAVQTCERQRAAILASMQEAVRSGNGLVIAIQAEDSFLTGADDRVVDVRLFPVYGVSSTAVAVRDVEDRAPIVYEIPSNQLCEALVTRGGAPWSGSSGSTHWRVAIWRTFAAEAAARTPRRTRPSDPPRPPGRTGEPPVRVAANAVRNNCTGDVVTCTAAAYHVGAPAFESDWLLPLTTSAQRGEMNHRTRIALQLDADAASSVWRWQHEVDTRLSLRRNLFGGGFTSRGDLNGMSFWDYYLNYGAREEWETLRPLATILAEHVAPLIGIPDYEAIIGFVQSVPYELIPETESASGLRTPLRTLYLQAGDCDSHALLAAVLLRGIGFQVAVLTGQVRSRGTSGGHAVLGIAIPPPPGAVLHESDEGRYVVVEMTAPVPIGDMSGWGMAANFNLARNGWQAHPLNPLSAP